MATLTKTKIDSIKVPGTYSDGDGLELLAREAKTGLSMSWRFRYQRQGKERRMSLGSYPEVGLAAARELAFACRKQLAAGIDPMEARKDEQRSSISFKDACLHYAETYGPQWRNGPDDFLREMQKHVWPVIGDKIVGEVDRQDILATFRPRWTEIPHQMRESFYATRRVLDFAMAHGWSNPEKRNPATWRGDLQHVLPPMVHKKQHRPALPWQQVPEFLTKLREVCHAPNQGYRSVRPVTYDVIEFQILTGVRPSEAREAKWSEIDETNRVWTIPAERMKIEKAGDHLVPLSEGAMRVLWRREQGGTYVFRTYGCRARTDHPISQHTPNRTLHSLGFKDAADLAISKHGFRSSLRDWAAETGWPDALAEAALAHRKGTQSELAYKRTQLMEQRRPMMEAWSKVCLGEWKPADVIPLSRNRRSG